MSQERTEKATPKKREDARKKGQIARGAELPAALSFLAAVLVLNILGTDVFRRIGQLIRDTSGYILEDRPVAATDAHAMLLNAGGVLAFVVVPVVLAGFASSMAGNFAQGGLSLTGEALKPKGERFNPANNIKRVFGLDSVVNLAKSLVKLVLVTAVAYTVIAPVIETAPALVNAPVGTLVVKLGGTLYTLALRCGLVLLVLALADYGYAWYKHERSLRMSKQEIRDEFKEQEGDPLVRSQRRRAARALAQRRSIAEVPGASVVITNPTHFAVALRYDRDKDAAPVVVAKGADHVAAKIREIARASDVPLVEDPPLARALFRTVEPGQIIPAEFFSAVAEVLAFVFRRRESAEINTPR